MIRLVGTIFCSFFKIGLFTLGGGLAIVSLVQQEMLARGWLTNAEFLDILGIAQMTPGPIAVNSATFVGQKMAGLPGAIVCTLGCITPSVIIVLILAWAYTKYRNLDVVQSVLGELRPAVVAMIAGAGLTIILMAFFGTSTLSEIPGSPIRFIEMLLFAGSLILLRLKKAGPIQIIFGTAVVGTILYTIVGGI